MKGRSISGVPFRETLTPGRLLTITADLSTAIYRRMTPGSLGLCLWKEKHHTQRAWGAFIDIKQQIHRCQYNIEAKLHLKSITVGKLIYDFQILTNPFVSEKILKKKSGKSSIKFWDLDDDGIQNKGGLTDLWG